MTAFQAIELAAIMTHFAAEIQRVRFYSDLSELTDGECHFLCEVSELRGGKIALNLHCTIGTYYPGQVAGDWHNYDDDLLVSQRKYNDTLFIPDAANGTMQYNNRYDRAYIMESITAMMDNAADHLAQIEAAKAAYEVTIF